jgi:hypothetical protein
MSSPRPHVPIWKRLLLALAILLIIVVLKIGYDLYQLVHFRIPESYAAWTTGNLMVEYLQTHTNKWPRNWDDLRSATNSLQEKGMPVYMSLGHLPEFVKIDWQANTEHLLQAVRSDSNATAHLVTRLDGSRLQAVWGPDTEPNAKIMRYLKMTLTTSNTVLEPTVAAP